ncbi:Tyrosine-protein kinase ITK/TSK [Camelus dromedarius]|uniref:Tyrosine-protein kinase n=1 Tax=Camelus dromedarius TaxID=9838 RepID=A0A5N4EDJ3_CAMDR|nr:Tyrosine-protein kinase ITK/TSK [Camelus dromedarius]
MVRDSRTPGTYTVSVFTKAIVSENNPCIKHYHIKETNDNPKRYYVAEKYVFDSIPLLVNYHQHNGGGLVTRLRYPVCSWRQRAPVTAGLRYGKWMIDPSELTFVQEIGSGQFGLVHLGYWLNKDKVAIKTIQEGAMSEEDFIEEAEVMITQRCPREDVLCPLKTILRPSFQRWLPKARRTKPNSSLWPARPSLSHCLRITPLVHSMPATMACVRPHPHQLTACWPLVCLEQSPLCLVFEFMEHGCLSDYLRSQRGLFAAETLLGMCLDVCEGMAYLEKECVIHRDLVRVPRVKGCVPLKQRATKTGVLESVTRHRPSLPLLASSSLPQLWDVLTLPH